MTELAKPVAARLDEIWNRGLPALRDRLDLLDRAATQHPLDPELRELAIDAAHKLAGSLGMFGHHHASEIARELELHLEAGLPAPFSGLTHQLRQTLFPS